MFDVRRREFITLLIGGAAGVAEDLCNDHKPDLPRSPYSRGTGSNLEIFSKAMASNSAA
jgi:hypothetical protein